MNKDSQDDQGAALAPQRLEHLNRVLRAIRNVNQLIVAEDDPRRLIEGVCANLTETLGYRNAWIALLGGEASQSLGLPETGSIAAIASSGFGDRFERMRARLERGQFSACMNRALSRSEVVVVDDPSVDCPNCPIKGEHGGRVSLVSRLACAGVTYGTLACFIPATYAGDPEEQDLFGELASDLAYALHKIAEGRKLEKSRQRLAFVIEGSGVGTWEWNAQTNETVFDERWASQLGYTIQELTPYDYATWERLVHPEDLVHALQVLTDCLQGRTLKYKSEYRMHHKDGHWVWILDQGRVMTRDDDGKPLAMFGTHTDITDQRRLLAQSRDAHRFLDAVIESSPFAMWVSDTEGTITRTNQALRDTLNLTDEQLVGHYNVFHDKNLDREHQMDMVRRVYEKFEPARLTLAWMSGSANGVDFSGGNDVFVDASLFPVVSDGKLQSVICQWADVTHRVQAEQELRQSRERYRRITANARDMIYRMSIPDGRYEFVNGASRQIMGHGPEDLYERPFLVREIIHPDWTGFFEDEWAKVLDGDMAAEYEYPIIHATSGEERWLHQRNVLVRDAEGKPEAMEGIVTDITERKRAQDALRLHSLVLNQIEDRVTITDLDGTITYVNEAEVRSLGYSRDELIGSSIKKYGEDPERGATQAQIVQETLEHGRWRGEVVNQSANGRDVILDCRTYVVLDEQGNKVALAGIATDITERKRAEEALRESERRFQRMLEVVPDMISIHSPEMDILYSNWQGFAAVPGDSRLANTKCYKTYRGFDEPCPDCRARQVLEAGVAINEQAQLTDGTWLDIRVIPILDVDGDVEMYMEWVRDITASKKAEEERERLSAQLLQAQKMESVGRLAGGVAHDFNNMLGVILGHTEILSDDLPDDSSVRESLEEIRHAAERSANLTRQLLAFARKQTVAPKVLDLDETLSSMLAMLKRLIGEDIDMAWVPGGDVWPVRIDPGQIDQIMANLCVNARDAIDGVGKVTIETGNAVFDEDYCRDHVGFRPGEYAMLSVSDDGCGMDADTLSHMFEPFFTTKDVGKGTGLGLATVYGIVKQNNGIINVYSEPGYGTTFKIYLPHFRQKGALIQEQPPERPIPRGRETLLLVEDEPSILKMTTMMLDRLGYTVVGATTPGEAIHLATEHAGDIHLLITDVVMPEMNGRDLAKNMLSLYPGCKFLYMSGYTAEIIAHHGILDEGVNFVQKPFSSKDIAAKVRAVLDRE